MTWKEPLWSMSITKGNATRYLISHGEARCGEWTAFFVHILRAQGLNVNQDTKAICTELASPNYPSYTEKEKSYGTLGLSVVFAVKNAIHNDVKRFTKTSGSSPGQGNPTSQPTFRIIYGFITKNSVILTFLMENHLVKRIVI
jgi:hypothetical protein